MVTKVSENRKGLSANNISLKLLMEDIFFYFKSFHNQVVEVFGAIPTLFDYIKVPEQKGLYALKAVFDLIGF